MDHKIMVIGGGAAALLVGFLVLKHKTAPQDSAPAAVQDTGYFSGLTPISGGASSVDTSGGSVISDPANSGSSGVGGGFDLGALFSGLFKSQADTSSLQIRSGANVAESSILAGMDFGSYGGSASVNHTDTGTVLNISRGDAYDSIVSNAYQTILGRLPDSGGAAFYKNAMANSGLTASGLSNDLLNSPEYAMNHQTPIVITANPVASPVAQPQQLTSAPAQQTVFYSAPSPQNIATPVVTTSHNYKNLDQYDYTG